MSPHPVQRPSSKQTTTTEDPRWARVVARDRSMDGQFYYSVATTGIYCRPSCASRTANPKNVRFHDSIADAEAAGFRACRRCKPDEPSTDVQNAKLVARVCRLIEQAEEIPSLDELAKTVNLSSSYFHRVFRSVTGVTPRDYAVAHRSRKVRDQLGRSNSITEAIYDAGFNSSGRFYEKSDEMLGMTPSDYRAGGANSEIRFAVGECSLGSVVVARSEKGVCAILLGDDPDVLVRDLQDRFPRARLIGGDAQFEALVGQVVGLIEAPALGLDLPLDIRGTAFQQRVWAALRQIPVGATATYTDIAREIGAPKSVRAVAGACAANALAVAIPCHRVVKSDGSLSGYRWGVERKRALIDREAQAA
ncbi:bifunctional DNA-binding transcriptional regulator/O6-methylguanine-DNA methyltransferase Ada [Brevundimonas fontaquae]|uniref:Bifunctional DNA-binding transcriptional regulator/O6-methylguanine-DNA methyltransferase Ada n=1 Tax=Brevundimonas fontaquae TaxID=2813778 RepID=A0ABX7LPN2_9CAUL|nr:bifunctional DNA-binding transcriptional regulator/O6-methylguanine-DNA methyltransferase Ada [Brevundimonas fontaquae]QSF54796.1 bifunctional DNA-binding transcriptional regulator/O6-methylguanine-DNA methyltransferase Ada [Brevundimonas fontaquae]